jgi:hypothetical protein
MAGRILYVTDKFGVSDGYKPAFQNLLKKAAIPSGAVLMTNIYNLVKNPLKKYGNETTWKFDIDKLDEIKRAFDARLNAIKPDLVVVSDQACLGVLTNGDIKGSTLEKMRGGVYEYNGYRIIVVLPITAIHQRVDSRIIENEDGDKDTQEPYQIKDGAQTLSWDWQRVGRYYHGRERKLPPFVYSVCRTLDDLFAARRFLLDSVVISHDIETGNYPPQITCAGYTGVHSDGSVRTFVIPLTDPYSESGCFWSEEDHLVAWSLIVEVNACDAIKTMQNGAYDSSYGIRDRAPSKNYFLDSQYMWWSIYMELPKRLDFITSILCDSYQYWKDDIKGQENETGIGDLEGYWRYNALDCYWTMMNTLYLLQLLTLPKNRKMLENFKDAMLRVYSGLAISMRGIKVDFARRDYHRIILEEEMAEANQFVQSMLDEPDFNVSSSDHKKDLLYNLFGLRERTARGKLVDQSKPKKGVNAPSGGKLPMKMAKTEHPLFRAIIETIESALEPRVQLSNLFGYTDPSRPYGVRGGLFLPTGRFRTALGATGTETTRFSSKKSNFWDGGNGQNIRGKYKDWLVPESPDHIFIDFDFSQSDDVFIGYESQDQNKIDVIESGRDGHAVHGELFYGIPYDSIVAGKKAGEDWVIHPIKGVRQNAKRVVHGTNFQMAGFTLYVTMGREAVVSIAELLGNPDAGSWSEERLVNLCAELMAKYRKKYPRLTKRGWYQEIADMLMRDGAITNCFGITRQFLGNPKDNGTQREATAFIGQSATAGNMNRVMYEVDHGYMPQVFRDGPNPDRYEQPLKMNHESHGFSIMLQVHDSFLTQYDTRHPRWKEAARNMLHVMNRPVIIHGREVRIKTEAEVSLRWGKSSIEWKGNNPHDLDAIIGRLKAA